MPRVNKDISIFAHQLGCKHTSVPDMIDLNMQLAQRGILDQPDNCMALTDAFISSGGDLAVYSDMITNSPELVIAIQHYHINHCKLIDQYPGIFDPIWGIIEGHWIIDSRVYLKKDRDYKNFASIIPAIYSTVKSVEGLWFLGYRSEEYNHAMALKLTIDSDGMETAGIFDCLIGYVESTPYPKSMFSPSFLNFLQSTYAAFEQFSAGPVKEVLLCHIFASDSKHFRLFEPFARNLG